MDSLKLIKGFHNNGTLGDDGIADYTAQLAKVNNLRIPKVEKSQKEIDVLKCLLGLYKKKIDGFADFIHGGIYTGSSGKKNIANYQILVKDYNALSDFIKEQQIAHLPKLPAFSKVSQIFAVDGPAGGVKIYYTYHLGSFTYKSNGYSKHVVVRERNVKQYFDDKNQAEYFYKKLANKATWDAMFNQTFLEEEGILAKFFTLKELPKYVIQVEKTKIL